MLPGCILFLLQIFVWDRWKVGAFFFYSVCYCKAVYRTVTRGWLSVPFGHVISDRGWGWETASGAIVIQHTAGKSHQPGDAGTMPGQRHMTLARHCASISRLQTPVYSLRSPQYIQYATVGGSRSRHCLEPFNAKIFMYKPWRLKVLFNLKTS